MNNENDRAITEQLIDFKSESEKIYKKSIDLINCSGMSGWAKCFEIRQCSENWKSIFWAIDEVIDNVKKFI